MVHVFYFLATFFGGKKIREKFCWKCNIELIKILPSAEFYLRTSFRKSLMSEADLKHAGKPWLFR